MLSAQKFAAAISLPAMLVILGLSGTADARTPCRCEARDCRASHEAMRRDWYLHRPSTPEEQAETRQLNHDALAQSTTPAEHFAGGGNRDYRRGQMQYQRELQEYRAAQQRYEEDMRRYQAGPGPQGGGTLRGRREMFAMPRPPHRPMTAEELDNDPFAPTGGIVDPNFAAPTPGLDGSLTGLTLMNARASGLTENPRRMRRRQYDRYGPPPQPDTDCIGAQSRLIRSSARVGLGAPGC